MNDMAIALRFADLTRLSGLARRLAARPCTLSAAGVLIATAGREAPVHAQGAP